MKKIEIKVVNTIKIQSIENGKRVTQRRFNMNVDLPVKLSIIIDSFIADVYKEVYAENRTAKEWVTLIKKHTRSKQLRSWAANIIWWKYSRMALESGKENVLYKLANSFKIRDCTCKFKQVRLLLERMGYPKAPNSYAAIREQKRQKAIKEYLKWTVKLGVI